MKARSAIVLIVALGLVGGLLALVPAGLSRAGAAGSVVFRVNAGGSLVSGTPDWEADGPSAYVNSGSNTYSTSGAIDMSDPSVPAGTPMALFQSERWDPSSGAEMQWDFPVVDGSYEVSLFFAEVYSGAFSSGARVFDVSVDGALVLDDYDVFADVGAETAVVKTFVTTVTDGNIDIDFAHLNENPAIKAIQISDAVPIPDTLRASMSTVDFGDVAVGNTVQQTVSYTNGGLAGDSPITINTGSLSGTDAAEFSHDVPDNTVLAPGDSITVTIGHAASSTLGAKTAALTIDHSGTNSPLTTALTASTVGTLPIGFGKSVLLGASAPGITSLDFGPDGRLYTAAQDGTVRIFSLARNGPDQYAVTDTETLAEINSIPNHDDDGTINPSVTSRLITGLSVAGTFSNPVIYITSSDPRIGAGPSGDDLNLDTNSGVLSRLTWTGATWEHLQLVRGLPRSEENHASNGHVLDESTNTLYVTQGGNTNHGAPSNNFALLPEFALSAAILSIDLDAIGDTTYDIPTLDDEDRIGVDDANDPFGGNNGKNQAKLVAGGPVQVHAPGFRNPYDLVVTAAGRMYTIDNGGNAGWGAPPVGEGPGGTCTNAVNEPGSTLNDSLHLVTGPGYYGGHPNPTRASAANTFNATNPQTPIDSANPVECDYRTNAERGILASFSNSTNGLTEYTANNFGGAMAGDLLAASFNNSVYRLDVDPTNGLLNQDPIQLFSSVGGAPLDVTAAGPADPHPGTVWVGDYSAGEIVVFEPNDFGGGSGPQCTGADDPTLDEDVDGFDNADEIDNGTDPCSAGSLPPDWDGDFLSDLNDPDDDNDSVDDEVDSFAIDADNGATTTLPVLYTWENDAPPAGGLLGLGFTGIMTNDTETYAEQFDPTKMTAGGAAGVMTVDEISDGTAAGAANSGEYGFQFGFAAPSAPFTARTRIAGPFAGLTPQPGQELGLAVGLGSQDDYVQVVVSGDAGGSITVGSEFGGTPASVAATPQDLTGVAAVDLIFVIDPTAGTGQARFAVDTGSGLGPASDLGPTIALPPSWMTAGVLAAGTISTAGAASAFPGTWDFIEVDYEPTPGALGALPNAIDFGDVVTGNSVAQTVTYTNEGVAGDPDITINTATLSGTDAAEFSHDLLDNTVLTPGESVVVTVTHTAGGTLGPKAAVLTLDHTGTNTPITTNLTAVTTEEVPVADVLINAGGGPYVDSLSRSWLPDTAFIGGSTYSTSAAVSGTTDDVLYQTERYGDFTYAIPVPSSGCYSVSLHFAEIYWGGPGGGGDGSRVFDVNLEGVDVATGYDVHAAVGYGAAVVRTFEADVTDTTVDIGFVTQADNAKISALELTYTGASCVPADPITGLAVVNDGPTPAGSATALTASVTGGTYIVYDWDLGDGTILTDAGASISHTYPAADSYTATVTATNPITTDTATTTVVVDPIPDEPISGLAVVNDGPTAVGSVTALTASVAGGTNIVYDWDLGDGTILTDAGPSISHTYPAADSYTATVTATNPITTDTATTTVVVDPIPDEPISGLAVVNDGPTAVGSVTALTASVAGGTNIVYDWDLGDGTILTDAGPSISHTYPAADSYTATVTATNPITTDTASTTVVVQEQAASAFVGVTLSGSINASTYGSGSFVITNDSPNAADIQSVTFDLRDGLITDAVFDPDGTAGDPVGKEFTPDGGAAATGQTTHTFGSPNGGGYDTLTIDFSDFNPGETFTFSVDIDPTSIKDAAQPGPSESGSVSGLELTGSGVLVDYVGGAAITGQLFAAPTGSSGGQVNLRADLTEAPTLSLEGGTSPTTVSDSAAVIEISGTPGATVELLHVDTALFLDGVPGGGFDIDPYERNTVVDIERNTFVIDASGTTSVPVDLLKSVPEGGINQFTAVAPSPSGAHRLTSNTLVVVFDPSSTGSPDTLGASANTVDFGDVLSGNSVAQTVTYTNEGVAGDPDITINTATLSGTDAAEFSHDLLDNTVLTPGGSVVVTVTHTAGGTSGPKAAVLTLDHTGTNTPITTNLTANTIEPPDPGSVVFRVNAGGSLVSGTPDWEADGPSAYVNSGSNTYSTSGAIDMSDPSVPAGTPMALFQSERWDPSSGAEMEWDFPVVDGSYEVSLFFAEVYGGAFSSGARVFDVSVDGALVLDDYDVFADVGAETAVVKTFVTTVTDGNIDIDFAHLNENPAIKAIQIRSTI